MQVVGTNKNIETVQTEIDIQIALFDNIVLPVLLHGEVWGAYGCNIVSCIQLRY